jgi:hypothetical protein
MTEVTAALEEMMIAGLRLERCDELFSWSGGVLEAAALSMAAKRFEESMASNGFIKIEEDALGMILDNDELAVRNMRRAVIFFLFKQYLDFPVLPLL